MKKQKLTLQDIFRKRADSTTLANKKLPWIKRQLKPKPIGVNNKDGSVSSHVLAAEVDDKGEWHVFPTLDYDGKEWKDMRVEEGEYPKEAFDYALKNKSSINFGTDGDFAIQYSQNGLIDHTKTENMKTKKKRTLKKMAMGSGNTGVIKGYMPDPSELFAQNDIDIAKAQEEAASNPLTIGLKTLGGIIASQGSGLLTPKGMSSNEEFVKESGGSTDNAIEMGDSMYAAMGTGPEGTGVEIEAEGGEVVETPDGQQTELDGASHENGGIPLEVPGGTLIFSDQLEMGGQTMAERKKAREKRLSKAQKSLDRDPSDKISRETFKKVEADNQMEEQADLKVQGFASKLDKIYEKAMGTGAKGVQEYKDGTDGKGVDWNLPDFTAGDLTGIAATLYGAFAPMANTRKNRATDTPNTNQFEGFGEDALKANEQAGNELKGQQAKNLKDIQLARTSAIKRGRSSARGVNTSRALDLSADSMANKAMADVYDKFSKQMMASLNAKAGLENQQDQIVMGGKAQADLANRQDKDNYYTQMGADKVNAATMMQSLGKNLNVNKGNQDFLDLLPDLSEFGLGYEKKGGKYVAKKLK